MSPPPTQELELTDNYSACLCFFKNSRVSCVRLRLRRPSLKAWPSVSWRASRCVSSGGVGLGPHTPIPEEVGCSFRYLLAPCVSVLPRVFSCVVVHLPPVLHPCTVGEQSHTHTRC